MNEVEVAKRRMQLCEDLNINYDPQQQDWGIENADDKRVKEFIYYFITNPLPLYIQYIIFELIIASYNELMLKGDESLELKFLFIDFIKGHNNKVLNDVVQYWKRIYNEEEFPVGKLLDSFSPNH